MPGLLSWGVFLVSVGGLIVWTLIIVRRSRILRKSSNGGPIAPRNRVITLDFLVLTFTLTQAVTALVFLNAVDTDTARVFATAERLLVLMVGIALILSGHIKGPEK
jgi:hypothetical protein